MTPPDDAGSVSQEFRLSGMERFLTARIGALVGSDRPLGRGGARRLGQRSHMVIWMAISGQRATCSDDDTAAVAPP